MTRILPLEVAWSFFVLLVFLLGNRKLAGSRERTEMKIAIPGALYLLYDREDIYNSLRERVPMPQYAEGSYYVPDECVKAVKAMSLQEQAEVVYDAIYEVHEGVRKSLQAQELVLDEGSRYELNAFLELPIAGYQTFGAMVHIIQGWLQMAGFELGQTFAASGYQKQMLEVETIDLEHMPLLTNVFLKKRREWAEQNGVADEGDLRDYLADKSKDVFGVFYGQQRCCPAHQSVKRQIISYAYDNGSESRVFIYTLARQVLRANGGGTPISSW